MPRKEGGALTRLRRAVPVLGVVLGIAILLAYPVSEAIDGWRRGEVAKTLDLTTEETVDTRKAELLEQAHAYNQLLAGEEPDIPAEDIWDYKDQLAYLEGTDTAFAYVYIPKLALTMPVYHSTSAAALSAGVGHVENTSLPVGGGSTHTVLSAHSGMSGMRAFDDIDKLEEGDAFGIKVLGEWYCYRVESCETVLPDDVSSFAIQGGRDLATLVTCTPYGVNDHRYLVHASRCDMPEGFLSEGPSIAAVATSPNMVPLAVCALIAGAGGLVVLVAHVVRARRGRR